MKKATSFNSLALAPQRGPVDRLGEEHLLGEDQVRAVVVGHLVVMAHRDRVKGAGDLAVAAEDAARQVDFVDLRIALARRDAVVGVVLGGHHADAVGGTGGRTERAADTLLEPAVLEPVELVAAPEALVDGGLLLRVLDCHRPLDHPREGRAEAAEGLPECAVGAADSTRLRPALNGDDVLCVLQVGECAPVGLLGVEARLHQLTVTITAVASTFRVARGSITFQPSAISWS